MARMLTEEEVEKLEKQRELQQRERKALAGMSPDSAMRYREAQERQHWDDLHRQTHGGLSRGEVLALGPDGSGRQARGIARAAELQAAREHEIGMQKNELETREKEAYDKRMGMENQGVGAAKLRYGYTDYDGKRVQGSEEIIAGQQAADKEKQRQHELAMLGQTQTFQGAQNTAERKNRLDIAGVQGRSTVEAAKAQAEARAADIASKERIAQGNIDAKYHAIDTKAATAAAGQLTGFVKALATLTNPLTGKLLYPMEELQKKSEAEISALIEKHGLRGQ